MEKTTGSEIVIGMVTSEIILFTNQNDIESMQNVLQQMTEVMEYHLRNQEVAIIYDHQKTQYDCILEKITEAGSHVILFYVTEDDESYTH